MQIIRVSQINSKDDMKGCETSPTEILKAFRNIDINEKNKVLEHEKISINEIHLDPSDVLESNASIYEGSINYFEKNFKTIFLGGDHSVTYPIVSAFKKTELDPLLIVFDSHIDCSICDKVPGNKEWLRELINDGFDSSKIILLSTRQILADEIEFLEKHKITMIKMDLLREGIEDVCDIVMERARKSTGFYVSIDIDSVDPAFAPGTNSLVPGGISSRDLIYFIKRLSLLKNLKGADIVEINPKRDVNHITVLLGAKILSELV
ncbi:MAG: arginase family protein [Nanoarchaeota archaeon]|nr:arginase family protein [Nanoarchaeota archaeon]